MKAWPSREAGLPVKPNFYIWGKNIKHSNKAKKRNFAQDLMNFPHG